MKRISIYIDGENFIQGIKSINKKYTDFKFDFENYIKYLTKNEKLVDVYYFGAPLKQELGKDLYSDQQKMFSRFEKLGWKVVLCKRRKREKDDGSEMHKIKEDDIRLALQMQKDAYDNKFDVAILFSGDGDFVPLPEYLTIKNKKIELVYVEDCVSLSLLRVCNFKGHKINKKILNKFFLRKKNPKNSQQKVL